MDFTIFHPVNMANARSGISKTWINEKQQKSLMGGKPKQFLLHKRGFEAEHCRKS